MTLPAATHSAAFDAASSLPPSSLRGRLLPVGAAAPRAPGRLLPSALFGRGLFAGGLIGRKSHAFGLPAIDGLLPGRGLQRGAVHAFEAAGAMEAATGLIAAFLSRVQPDRPLLWITGQPQVDRAGFARLGLDHRRVTLAWAQRAADRIGTAADALRNPGFAAVVIEQEAHGEAGGQLAVGALRRLADAAAEGRGLALLLASRPEDSGAETALTAWRVRRDTDHLDNGIRWHVALRRGIGGNLIAPPAWTLGWDRESLNFHDLAALPEEA